MWWWIVLGISAFLAIAVTAILRIRVYVIIKSDTDGELMLRYKILWKTFGEQPDPNNPILKAIKKSTGIDRIESSRLRSDIENQGLQSAAGAIVDIIGDLLRELADILKYCTATKFELKALRSSDDAADAAIAYGEYCAIVYPIIGAFANALGRVYKRGRHVDIRCGFGSEEDYVQYNFTIFVRMHRVLSALVRISIAEAKRQVDRDEQLARERARHRAQQNNQNQRR